MTLALVSAMHEELAAVLALMPDEQRVSVAGREFWRGHLHGQEVVAVLSRIGKVAAATTAAVLIERFGATRIVFTGVAGGLAEGVRVGDVVVADAFLQHDLDASPIFPKYEIPLYGLSRLPADPALTQALEAAAHETVRAAAAMLGEDVAGEFGLQAPRVHRGLLVSGDRFVATTAESAALRAALPLALACEMEGAAVAQVCHDYGVPFAALRTISDRADDTAHVDFARFIHRVAGPYASDVIRRFLERLPAP
jgi:adenosylhomocysteine nucleosidase